ncbi:MAG: hypothetical protein UIH41_11495, partial [Treponemataceae bacterium]|nr:hypothetical protein [Treponemataceae bacterium]
MKKNSGKCLAIFAGLMMIFVSCASNQIENNYTDEEMMISKLDSIQKSIKENPMKSFYDFILMYEKELKSENTLFYENQSKIEELKTEIFDEIKNQTEKYIA